MKVEEYKSIIFDCDGYRIESICYQSEVNDLVPAYLLIPSGISEKTAILASYALCGFANFASIGIQLGGIGSIAPERKKDLAKLVTKAMFGGALASWLTATIAGILI